MPVTYLKETTLSAAITAGANEFQVASTTNIVAGKMLLINTSNTTGKLTSVSYNQENDISYEAEKGVDQW